MPAKLSEVRDQPSDKFGARNETTFHGNFHGIAGLLGFLSYGLSLAAFVLALRHLGSARTGAYFSTAPFAGSGSFLVGSARGSVGHVLAGGS